MKNFVTLGVLILLLAGNISGNEKFTQNVRGKVFDRQTEAPLIGAAVVIKGSNPFIGTATDENGDFILKDVPVGRLDIEISYLGYQTKYLPNLLLTSGKELILNVALEEMVVQGQEIVVKANVRKDQPLNKMATVSARSFTVEETQRYAGSLGDPSRMVANYAGVLSVSDQRNDIIIRGNSPSGLLWRLDGMEIPSPNHFGSLGSTGGPISILNNNQLANSDFYTGAFPAEFGNALSGAFDLKMRSGNNQEREHVFQVGFNGFELGTEGPFIKKKSGSYLINYRYSTLELLNSLGADFGTGSSIPQYQDLSFKVNLPGTKLGNFQLMGLGGLSYIEMDSRDKNSNNSGYGLNDAYLRFGSDMGFIALSHSINISENTRLTTKISQQAFRYTTKIDSVKTDNSLEDFYRARFNEGKTVVSSRLNKKINTKNNFEFGVTYEWIAINYIDSFNSEKYDKFIKRVDAVGNMQFIQSFFQYQHKFSDQLTATGGIHYQQLFFNNTQAIEPRLGLKWQFMENRSLNFGYGLHSQAQPKNIYLLETYDSTDNRYFRTNEKLGFTHGQHFVIGYDHLLSKNLRLKIESYYQNLWDVPVTETQPEFSMLNSGDFFAIPLMDSLVNKGTGKNYGIEFTLEKFLSERYYFLITTSLFDSKYKGYDKIERNTAFNGNFVINALFGYEFEINPKSTLEFNLKTVYAGGKRYIPIDLSKSINEGEESYDWSHAYENRVPDYFKMDGRVSLKKNGKKFNQEWAIDIQNITNKKNVLRDAYNDGEIKTEYQTGFFPMFLYRINF